MVYKVFFYVLIIFLIGVSSQKLQKCSDGDLTACGPNAKCIDGDTNREFEHDDAQCTCLKEYYGPPPNCQRICKSDCKSNEYCDLDEEICKEGCRTSDECEKNERCENNVCIKPECFNDFDCKSDESCIEEDDKKMCMDSCKSHIHSICGNDAVCKGIDHIKHCSCNDGYFPNAGRGCRKKEAPDIIPKVEELNCKKYCGPNGNCKIIDNDILCYCKHILANPFNNSSAMVLSRLESGMSLLDYDVDYDDDYE